VVKKLACLIALIAVLSVPTMSGTQLTPEEKRTLELKPAVVLVLVSVKVDAELEGKPIDIPPYTTVGSGFLFRHDGYLITNGHVVQNAKINEPQAKEALEQKLRKTVYDRVFQAIDQVLASKGHPPLTAAQKQEFSQSGAVRIHYHNPTLTVFLANGTHVPGELTPNYSPEIGVGKDVAIVKIDGTNLPSVPLGDSNKVHEQDRITVIGYPGVASNWGATS
jgi:S1-C subfamily serine protease